MVCRNCGTLGELKPLPDHSEFTLGLLSAVAILIIMAAGVFIGLTLRGSL